MTAKRVLLAVSLTGLYLVAVLIRVEVCTYQKARYSFLPFTMESALLYRYARMAAEGERIPYLDEKAQYPEGLRVSRDLSLGMELVTGYLYRFLRPLWGGLSFHDFIRFFTPFFFSFGVLAAYLVAKEMWKDEVISLIPAFFYAVMLPSVLRSTGQEISKENFVLPLIFFHILFLLRAIGRSLSALDARKLNPTGEGNATGKATLANSVLAGVLLFIALACWEGTQVYFYLLVIFVILNYFWGREPILLFRFFAVQVVFALLAGILIPYLRNHSFLFSYSMMFSYAFLGTYFLGRYTKLGKRANPAFFVLLLALFSLLSLFISKYGETYSHYQSLLFYKLRYLNRKPIDPSLLPYEVRVLWTPALLAPSLWNIVSGFSTLLLWGILSFPLTLRQWVKRKEFQKGFLLFFLITFFSLYLLFDRMQVWFVFFLSLSLGSIGCFIKERKKWLLKRCSILFIIWLVVAGLSLRFEANKIITHVAELGVPLDYPNLVDMIEWVKANTDEDAVILTHFVHSPPILTYTGRAILFHPKYESRELRDKSKEYAFALFSPDEDRFYQFCQKNKVDYFVFPRGTFSDRSVCGWRYVTNTPESATGANAYKFEYFSDGLKKFGLVYKNGKYRIYKVYKPEEMRMANRYLLSGDKYLERGMYFEAIKEFKEAVKIYPNCSEAHSRLGVAYYQNGDTDKAIWRWREAYRINSEQKKVSEQKKSGQSQESVVYSGSSPGGNLLKRLSV